VHPQYPFGVDVQTGSWYSVWLERCRIVIHWDSADHALPFFLVWLRDGAKGTPGQHKGLRQRHLGLQYRWTNGEL
jgi:hypothetical protein